MLLTPNSSALYINVVYAQVFDLPILSTNIYVSTPNMTIFFANLDHYMASIHAGETV